MLERLRPGYPLALAVLILGPLLGPGYLLTRDAVSTPRSYLTDTALGLGDAAPRAVPQDFLLAVLSQVLDGGVVVKALLLMSLWLAGWGAMVLVRSVLGGQGAAAGGGLVGADGRRHGGADGRRHSGAALGGTWLIGAELVAATVAIWNPYVAERLLQGHWSLLAGYAALPWIGVAVRRRSWAMLAVCLAAAALTPTGALLALVTALVLLPSWRVLVVGVLASAPWLYAAVGAGASDPAGVAAFAARAEPGLGTVGSLLGLGGIWNAAAVPASRTTWWALVGTAMLVSLVGLGVMALLMRHRRAPSTRLSRVRLRGLSHPAAVRADEHRPPVPDNNRRVAWRLALLAAAGILGPALAATPWGIDLLEWAIVNIPGAGLLRDTQKWVALAMPAYVVAAAAGAAWLANAAGGTRRTTRDTDGSSATPDRPAFRAAHRGPGSLVFATCIALTLIALPDLAWGVGGELAPVRYPDSWPQVASRIDGPGDVAVLPSGMFRDFPYSGPALDPAPRLLPRDVLQTGDLVVAGRTVAGEDSRARAVERALAAGAPARELARRGVGWVLVERTTPGPLNNSARTLAETTEVFADAELALYRVPDVQVRPAPARAPAIAAHLVWLGVLVGGVTAMTLRRRRLGTERD
mgnify:CR=1 FL=1